ncbi:hypothetical protein ABC974_21705 [Sphingomonas oligophenolica]|uniref:DUF4345 domain-containing protein n=1 Tax=Sphingomonas oligophenolica TaxID=301154 RepID=A0ABU9Y8Y8_9SPHN
MRKLLGIIIGSVFAVAILAAMGWGSDQLYPLMIDTTVADETMMSRLVAEMPLGEKLLWVAPWLLGSFGGAWLALRVCDWKWAGWITAGLMMAIAIADILDLPYPVWMQACAVLLPITGGWLAARLHHKPYPGEPLLG